MPCIVKSDIPKIKALIKEKGGVRGLRDMGTAGRIALFESFLNPTNHSSMRETARKDAEWFNRRIEERLLKPAQVAAVNSWLRKLNKTDKSGHVKADTFNRDNDIVKYITESSKIFSPKDGKPFLEGLVKQKLGFSATREASIKLTELAQTANQARKKLLTLRPDYLLLSSEQLGDLTDEQNTARMELGFALVNFKEQYDIMKIASKAPTEFSGKLEKVGYNIAGTLKSTKASSDLSFAFRQLSGVLLSDPKSGINAIKTGVKQFWDSMAQESGQGMRLAMAEIYTRPHSLNGNYNKFGLDIGLKEEAFPESYVERIKIVGRPFKASNESFSLALQVARANMFDAQWDMTLKDVNGDANTTNRIFRAQEVGKIINTLTGRGTLPTDNSRFEKWLNVALFSPRWLSSRVQMITNLRFAGDYFKKTPRGLAARAAVNNLLYTIAMSALLRAIFRDKEDDAWWEKWYNPVSTDFMKAQIGDVHIDISSGVGNIITFATRLTRGKQMSQEGVVLKKDRGTILKRWLMSKESPFAQTIMDAIRLMVDENPKDFNYQPITYKTFLEQLVPISVSNLRQDGEWTLGSFIFDIIGISASSYGVQDKHKGKSEELVKAEKNVAYHTQIVAPSVKLRDNAAIKTKLNEKDSEKAQAEFVKLYNREATRFVKSGEYKRMSWQERSDTIRKIRTKAMNDIKKKWNIK